MHTGLTRGERAAGLLMIVLGASLLLANVHPFGDARLFANPRVETAQLPASIPADARSVLAADCMDCHSSLTRTPIYGRFAPVSWLLERDIVEARGHLNLSAWESYDADQQQELLAEIAEEAKAGHMPPPQYLLMHRGARLQPSEIASLLGWVHAAQDAAASAEPAAVPSPFVPAALMQKGSVYLVAQNGQPTAGTISAPDATRGADLFNRRCTGCHTLAQSREGPKLGGVYGRAAASVPGFPYSAALKGTQITWNEQTLDKWLTDPDAFVPGVNMDFRVPKPQERADIIAFLKQAQ
jgi:cytochrome c